MLDGFFSSAAVQKLQAGIRFTARRHNLITNNIANVTTPGYRAKDMSEAAFLGELRKADGKPNSAMQVIDSRDAGSPGENGNNVNIEREMSKLSRNAMMHNILISLLDKQFNSLETALRGKIL